MKLLGIDKFAKVVNIIKNTGSGDYKKSLEELLTKINNRKLIN